MAVDRLLVAVAAWTMMPAQPAYAAMPGWNPLTGVSGTGTSGGVNALGLDDSNSLYVGGNFATAGGVTVNDIALWNGSDWSGFTGPNDDVYFGGFFGLAGNSMMTAYGIAEYDDTSTSFSNFVDATTLGISVSPIGVYAVALDTSSNVYVGGSFTSAASVANTARIAMHDGTNWLPLGAGIDDGRVNAIIIDGAGNLYVGGTFTSVNGGTPAAGIACGMA